MSNRENGRSALSVAALEIAMAYALYKGADIDEITRVLASAYKALYGLKVRHSLRPAVPVATSVTPSSIICLEDGLAFASLKRHLRLSHGMTPAEYRAKWQLPPDYPFAAAAYREQRRAIAIATTSARAATLAGPAYRGSPLAE